MSTDLPEGWRLVPKELLLHLRDFMARVFPQQHLSRDTNASAGELIERCTRAMIDTPPDLYSCGVGEKEIARAIMLAIQFGDFGHRTEEGYVSTVAQIHELEAKCNEAARAILALPHTAEEATISERPKVDASGNLAIASEDVISRRDGSSILPAPALDPHTVEQCAKTLEDQVEYDGAELSLLEKLHYSHQFAANRARHNGAAAIRSLTTPKHDVVYRGNFPIEVLYEGEDIPTAVKTINDLRNDKSFTVLRIRIDLDAK